MCVFPKGSRKEFTFLLDMSVRGGVKPFSPKKMYKQLSEFQKYAKNVFGGNC